MEFLISQIIKLVSDKLNGISLVDEDYGQLEAIDNDSVDMYPITFPAVLIETPETEWSDISMLAQKGVCSVRVRLIIDCYDDTHASSPTLDRVRQRNELRHQLHALLQGFRPDGDGALIRTKSRFFTFNHGIKVYEMTYSTTVSEQVKETTTTLKLCPHLTASLESPSGDS